MISKPYQWMSYEKLVDLFDATDFNHTGEITKRSDGESTIYFHEVSYYRNGRIFTAWLVSTQWDGSYAEDWRLPTPSEARWLNTRRTV